VRFAVACALPSIFGVEWLEPTHPAVTTLMELTADEDADVRDWATFGLVSQLMVDGTEVRQCLLARVDDPDEDTRAEAAAGLARRHTPGIARHIRDALAAEAVGRLTVAAAASLGHPSLAEPLTRLVGWWDVDVDLLERARRRCEPGRISATVDLVTELLNAAEVNHLRLIVSSELLDDTGEPDVHVVGAGTPRTYSLEALMRRAGGSVDAAVRLIQHDLDQPEPIPAPPEAPVATAVSDYTSRRLIEQLKNEISQLRVSRLPAGLQARMRGLQMQALQGLHAEFDAQLPKQVLEIDGRCFDNLDEFFEHVGQRLIPGASWGKNLDAFNDILRGGFGTPDEGFMLRWVNASVSRERLGFDETVRYIERKLTRSHASNVPAVEADLASARRGEGETLFDLITDIIRAHGPGGIEAEDGVWLDLE
jgi:RNAse (barnase) inhibitor barstar